MMRTRILPVLLTALCVTGTGSFGAEPPPAAATTAPRTAPWVTVSGEGLTALHVSVADLQALPRRSLQVDEHGVAAQFSGVELGEILRQAGAPLGEHLRGANLALYVIVDAADHYRAVYALAELDSALTTKTVLLADQRDGKSLSDHEGPFRVVASDEKRPARWVRQVASITLVAAQP